MDMGVGVLCSGCFSMPRIAGSATKSGWRWSTIEPMRAKRQSSMIPKPLINSGGEEGFW